MLLLFIIINYYTAYCGNIGTVGNNFLQAYSSNKGQNTYYQFIFSVSTKIPEDANIQVFFPIDYNKFNFNVNLECFLQIESGSDYL